MVGVFENSSSEQSSMVTIFNLQVSGGQLIRPHSHFMNFRFFPFFFVGTFGTLNIFDPASESVLVSKHGAGSDTKDVL